LATTDGFRGANAVRSLYSAAVKANISLREKKFKGRDMKRFLKSSAAVAVLAGAALFLCAPARADDDSAPGGVGYSPDSGGYCDDEGCPDGFWDFPVAYCPVYFEGTWFRGPLYYRNQDGRVQYWIHGGWRFDQWNSATRPDWACVNRFGPALGYDFYIDHGFHWRESWRRRWFHDHGHDHGHGTDHGDHGGDHHDHGGSGGSSAGGSTGGSTGSGGGHHDHDGSGGSSAGSSSSTGSSTGSGSERQNRSGSGSGASGGSNSGGSGGSAGSGGDHHGSGGSGGFGGGGRSSLPVYTPAPSGGSTPSGSSGGSSGGGSGSSGSSGGSSGGSSSGGSSSGSSGGGYGGGHAGGGGGRGNTY
jgi:hypothetical protein